MKNTEDEIVATERISNLKIKGKLNNKGNFYLIPGTPGLKSTDS